MSPQVVALRPEAALQAVARKLAAADNGANVPPGGGSGDSTLEARIAKLEVGVSHVERDVADIKTDVRSLRNDITGIRTTDFRLTFGAIIAVALGLAGIMAKGFHWL